MQQGNQGWSRHLNTWGMPLVLLALVLACYWPALHGRMLWDDPAHVPRPDLQSWSGLGRIWTEMRATQQYYPVLFTAFWLEHRVWGDETFGYHLANVVLHTLSCWLLAVLLRRLWLARGRPPEMAAGIGWLAAALFAVHPICVESVAWISEQKNTLSLVFYLSAALVYLEFATTRRLGTYVFGSFLFLLALGSKSVTATLPAALLVVLWWTQGRLQWRRDALPLVPWLAAGMALGLFTAWFEHHWIGAEGMAFELTFLQRVLLAGRILWFYLGKLAWPVDLTFFYARWDVPAEALGWVGYLVAAVAVTGLLWAWRARMRGPLAGWLLFAGSLFPALGFFNVYPFLFSYVADHFQYLASVGAMASAAGGVAVVLAGWGRTARRLGLAACVLVLAVLAVLANRQSALYRDKETLFRATLARVPASWIAHQILATTLAAESGRDDEAIAEYREVQRLNPAYADAHFGLGAVLARRTESRGEAIAEYERAIALRPDYAEAHNNLGFELARIPGRAAEAVTEFEAALRSKPEFDVAHANLADQFARSPAHVPEAVAHYQEALRLNPGLHWARCHFAYLLSRLPGKQDEARAEYAAVLQLDPNYIDAHNGLALLYAMTGRIADARREWETVLRLDPRMESARRNLRRLDEPGAP
ncbi:MAG TPA: tetratricopeptide repeat protein [Lacunisphaera sp.]|nr:tetratricopeptide repeat protein [Lacunisphaera sp.]